MRSASRDVLLRAALLATASAFYCSPLSFLSSVNASAGDAASRVVEIRLWLTLLATVAALVGVISTQLVLASCLHAAVHVAQAVWHVPLCTGSPLSCWHVHGLATCVYEYGSSLSFVLVLRYVLMPLPSTLATTRRHSRQLKRFFQQHDPKYVSLVDRLLDDYTGNERLLFARIRKIYRAKTLSAPQ